MVVLDLGGCQWLLMGEAGHVQPLLLTAVAVTKPSFPPAHSGGEWQGKKKDSVSSEVQGQDWVAGWGLDKCGDNGSG